MTMAVLAGASSGNGNLFVRTSYTGVAGSQIVTTGQNLAALGVSWVKQTSSTRNHLLYNYVSGVTSGLYPNLSNAYPGATSAYTPNSSGFIAGAGESDTNQNGQNYVALTWLEQNGYMERVTWTGNSTNGRAVSLAKSSGKTPKMAFIKNCSLARDWVVYHENLSKSATLFQNLTLNNSDAEEPGNYFPADPAFDVFLLSSSDFVNGTGSTYVMYVFYELTGKSKFGTQSGTTTINTGLPSIKAFLKKSVSAGDWYFFYEDGGTWYHIKPNTTDARATGLISVSGGDVTLSGDASTGNGIYAAWS